MADSTSSSSDSPVRGRGGLILRLVALVALLVLGLALVRFTPVGELFDKERMIAFLDSLRGHWWAPLVLFAIFAMAAPLGLPASPILIGGGVVFGRLWGTIYNIVGLVGGAIVAYAVGKALGREAVVQLAGPKLRRAERLFQKRSFWPLVQVRFLPIPFSVVGYAAALAGVSTSRYIVTSTIGLVPATVLHTWYAPTILLRTLAGEPVGSLLAQYGVVILVFNLLVGWPQIRDALRRRRRYREIQEIRSQRHDPSV